MNDVLMQQAVSLGKISKAALKSEKIGKGFAYNGLCFQIDDKSRLSIVTKALALILTENVSVDWISNSKDDQGNDIIYTFTKEEFLAFAKEVEAYYEKIVLGKDK